MISTELSVDLSSVIIHSQSVKFDEEQIEWFLLKIQKNYNTALSDRDLWHVFANILIVIKKNLSLHKLKS